MRWYKSGSCGAGFLTRAAFHFLFAGVYLALSSASPGRAQAAETHEAVKAPIPKAAERQRVRPDVPASWPPGRRIVIHVTPSLAQSYTLSCDVPIPAWTYVQRGHWVTVLLDSEAVTGFRRDSGGKTPLDRLDILEDDYDSLAAFLKLSPTQVPKNFGDLFKFLAGKGVRIVANGEALQALRIGPGELDPVVTVLDSKEVKKLVTNPDALLPYDEVGVPFGRLFADEPHEASHPH